MVLTDRLAVRTEGRATPRRYLMCPPTYFDVTYRINPWMHPGGPRPDRTRAAGQWQAIVEAYRAVGHRVEVVDPAPGLPDLVFTANAGLVIDGRVLVSRFRHAERATEPAVAARWFAELGFTDVAVSATINEGEGDLLPVGPVILAATGFRTEPAAHAEVAEFFDRRVVSLELVDDRLYHLDTALAVLSETEIAFWPDAFSTASRGMLMDLFGDPVVASQADAMAFGLNACSDGARVLMPSGAPGLRDQLVERGFDVVTLDTGELQMAGGAVKCCTLELRC
ncbi:MAG: amidinotransferase [Acidimicrobiales bacterium]